MITPSAGQPFISIITATLNNGARLKSCLDSVFAQHYQNYEHIVIDGESTDRTKEVLKTYPNKFLSWVSEPDSGIAEAMNKGIHMARGEWLLFLQADDKLASPESLQKAAKHFAPHPAIISFKVKKLHQGGKETIIDNPGWCLKTNFKTTVGHQGAFIHRELFERLGEYDTRYKIAMDYEWFMRAFRSSVPIIRAEGIIAEMSDNGISSQTDWDSLAYRFSEEKRIHGPHAPKLLWRLTYMAYWAIYPSFRRLKEAIKRSFAE